ncbi:MAG: ABC transporter permease, partial [Bacteroidales bacterium]
SGVSVLSIAVSTASMVLILSVMNGMSQFVSERFGNFDPDLKVEAVYGKYFEASWLDSLRAMPGVVAAVPVIEDQALFMYNGNTCMVKLKGVDTGFDLVSNLPKNIEAGKFYIEARSDMNPMVVGGGIFAKMGMYLGPGEKGCTLYAVDAFALNAIQLPQAFRAYPVYPSGVFSSVPEYDNQYIISSLSFVSKVFQTGNKFSGVEVKVDPTFSLHKLQKEIQRLIGNSYKVRDRIEQQQSLFSSMKAEKLIVISVFAFVMLIATFTMVASLMLLIYDKRSDIAILSGMGLSDSYLKRIFFADGMFISLSGALIGLAVGTAITLGQQYFGWVKLGNDAGTYITDVYPVEIEMLDLVMVLFISL